MLMTCNRWERGLAARRLLLCILCCAPLLALGGCRRLQNAMSGTTGGDWVQFTSNSAGFTASYPSVPTDKIDADGQGHTYGLSYDNDNHYLSVVYDPNTDPAVPLTDRCTAIRDKLHVTNMTITDVEVDGHRGVEASYQRVREGVSYTSRMRMFYVKGVLYQVQGVMATASGGQSDVDQFFAGFHFLPNAAP